MSADQFDEKPSQKSADSIGGDASQPIGLEQELSQKNLGVDDQLNKQIGSGDLGNLESDMGSMMRDLNGLENEGAKLDPSEVTKAQLLAQEKAKKKALKEKKIKEEKKK